MAASTCLSNGRTPPETSQTSLPSGTTRSPPSSSSAASTSTRSVMAHLTHVVLAVVVAYEAAPPSQ